MTKCVLGDVAKRIQTGPFGSQLHQCDYSLSGTPVVMPKDLSDGTIVDATIARVGPQHVERLARHKLKEGDLLFSRRGDVGRCALVRKEQEGWLCGTGCLRVEVDVEKADYKYLYYFLRRDDVAKWLESHAVGAIMLNINPSIVSQLPVVLPSLDAQHNIAKVLSTIDRKIALNRKRIATLEAMAKEIYDYWFVQFDFPDAHGRPYKSSGGAMVYNPDLKREIPKGWEVVGIEDVCDVVDCLHSKKPEFCFESEESYLLTLENLTKEGYIDVANKFYISRNDYKSWIRNIEVRENDFVITNAGRAGDIVRIPRGVVCAAGRNMTVVRPRSIDPSYLRAFFYGEFTRAQVSGGLEMGSLFANFNVRTIKRLSILVPPRDILERLCLPMRDIVTQTDVYGAESVRLIVLREFLIPLLMNGQVKVR